MNPLVSIITPCYNGEIYISRFLDSVLTQDYDKIQLIVINDGSTDNTQGVLESYRSAFKQRGYEYILLTQDNAGQSEAINKGLEVFSGEYMTWIDSDDELTPNAISRKVAFMEQHHEIGLSICKIKVLDFESREELREQKRIPPKGWDDFFYDLIAGKNVFYTPGGYMVRSSMFRDAMNKPLKIQSPREIGQNFQLLLPIAYKYPVGYIDEYLFFYSVRKGSHSRVTHSFEEKMRIVDISYDVLTNIAKDIEKEPVAREKILRVINTRILKNRIKLLLIYKQKDNLSTYVKSLKGIGSYDRDARITYLSIKYPILRVFFSFERKVENHLRSFLTMKKH